MCPRNSQAIDAGGERQLDWNTGHGMRTEAERHQIDHLIDRLDREKQRYTRWIRELDGRFPQIVPPPDQPELPC